MYLLSGHTSTVWSVAFSGDGSKVVSGSWDNTVKLWSADNGEVIQTLSGDVDMTHVYECIINFITVNFLVFEDFMNTLIGYILLMTLMFSLAAGLYFGLKTIRLI
jgi:WD40 repeat protein